MEDHDGELMLDNRPGGGAIVKLVFQTGGVAEDDAGEAQDAERDTPIREAMGHGA